MTSRINVLYVFGVLLVSNCGSQKQNTVYVLPDGFQGNAAVIFNQSSGVPVEYSNGYRVYRIPRSGILKTAFKPDEHGGYAALKFCYASRFRGIGPTPAAAYLPYINALNPATPGVAATTIICFNYTGATQGQARADIFSVSRVAKADSLFEQREALFDQILPPFPPEDSLSASGHN